jgi:DNA-binding MarR family transcriptional regulator
VNPSHQPAELAVQLLELIPLVMRTLAAELRRTGRILSPSQFAVLVMLQAHDLRLSDLAAFQAVSLPTISAIVAGLADRGWVQRTQSAQDRRVVIAGLTTAGREQLREIRDLSAAPLAAALARTSSDERRDLAAGLDVLRTIFAGPEEHPA